MGTLTGSWSPTETTATLSATFSGGNSDFTGYRYLYYYVMEGSSTNATTIKNNCEYSDILSVSTSGGTTNFSVTIRGLGSGTTYSWYFYLGYKGSNESTVTWLESQYNVKGKFTTDEEEITIAKWDWYSRNGEATAAQTSTARAALTNHGATSNFSYLVWNDMVDKVAEVASAAGYSWQTKSGTYLSKANTKMSSSSKTLTAARFNALWYNVWVCGGPVSSKTVSTGDIVYGSYFTTLMTAVNSWIDKL